MGFSAIEKLHALGVECPSNLRMKWMALALQIEKKNSLLNEQCSQLSRKFEHDGLSTCILKGQGNCLNYPEGLRNRRQCGDIDVWTVPFENEECRLKKQRSAAEGKANEECSEADDMGEQQLFTHCKFKEEFIKLKQVSSIGQQLKEKCVCEPWMICEPNEKEGRKLLEEIMKGGIFGQYDNRDAALKNGGMVKHGVWKLKRVMRLVRSYPEEALWEPVFRVWHLGWRKIHG